MEAREFLHWQDGHDFATVWRVVNQVHGLNKVRQRKAGRLPFALINMAVTADGKIATANRAVSSFGSARDRENLFELRATADAVMSGAGTVGSGKVMLGPGAMRFRRRRVRNGLSEFNIRVIVSGSGGINPDAEIFKHRFSPIIVLCSERAPKRAVDRLRELGAEVKICGRREIDFLAAFRWLREKWGVRRLLCEGGGEVNDALFRAGLVQEVHTTICPIIFGGRTAPTMAEGIGVKKLADAAQFRLKSMKRAGEELFVVFEALPRRLPPG